MQPPEPILVADLFPEVLDSLLKLLSGLSAEDWQKPTACPGWSVKDVALHLLGGEIGNLSGRRDQHTVSGPSIAGWEELVSFIDDWNRGWVRAARRISPRLLVDLLEFTGGQMCDYFRSLDPFAMGGAVSWAGPEPAPVWLDLAREYTERWHHQQHIRDATGRPGLKEPRYMAPALATFVWGLPRAFEAPHLPSIGPEEGAGRASHLPSIGPEEGAGRASHLPSVAPEEGAGQATAAAEAIAVTLTIAGASGGQWSVVREGGAWRLYAGAAERPAAQVTLDEDLAWRLFTRGVDPDAARERAALSGDRALGLKVLDTISIIA
jgi:uncharacterized protein (TIGR03083 family)